jgi:hypothetical protein
MSNVKLAKEQEKPPERLSVECRENLSNPTRFPTESEWESMTPIERTSFIMGMED